MKIKFFSVLVVFNLLNLNSLAQDNSALGIISGNIQAIGQYYQEDTLINAALPEHLYGFNGFANVNYQKGDFRAGGRYESYLNTLEGYPSTFKGTGIGYRYASWNGEGVGVTVGNFYDQFGSFDYAWYLAIILSFVATALHLPIDERPLQKEAVTP